MTIFSRIPIFFLFLALTTGGCATMSAKECLTADWRLIGFEDASNGYPVQRIGEHREACTEVRVVPNLEEYTTGHRQGVLGYCTTANGYAVGLRGREYAGICPPEMEYLFLAGYNPGRDIHQATEAVRALERRARALEEDLEELEAELRHHKEALHREEPEAERRKELRAAIRNLENEWEEREHELRHVYRERDQQARRLYELESRPLP